MLLLLLLLAIIMGDKMITVAFRFGGKDILVPRERRLVELVVPPNRYFLATRLTCSSSSSSRSSLAVLVVLWIGLCFVVVIGMIIVFTDGRGK